MAAEIIYGLNSYFTFRIESELFAVNIGNMTKILELTELTEVPNMPKACKGIINVFGDVIPVFDGRLKFGLPEKEPAPKACILILVFGLDGQTVSSGIIVDSVEKVVVIEQTQIQDAATLGERFNAAFTDGMAMMNDEPVVILNMERIFSTEDVKLITTVE
jgi:purine-binding chemotaxis protein CheW